MDNTLTLREAIERWRALPGAPANAFEWYRRQAHQTQRVDLGSVTVATRKTGGTWKVDARELDAAVRALQEEQEHIEAATAAHQKGIILGASGASIRTTWGGYTHHGAFRYEWSTMERLQRFNDGTWICNHCNKPATLHHERPECHRCQDWNGCGRDCTLSLIQCQTCNVATTP